MVRVARVARSSAVPSSTVTLIVPPWVSLTLQMLRNVAKFHRIKLIPYPTSALPAGLQTTSEFSISGAGDKYRFCLRRGCTEIAK